MSALDWLDCYLELFQWCLVKSEALKCLWGCCWTSWLTADLRGGEYCDDREQRQRMRFRMKWDNDGECRVTTHFSSLASLPFINWKSLRFVIVWMNGWMNAICSLFRTSTSSSLPAFVFCCFSSSLYLREYESMVYSLSLDWFSLPKDCKWDFFWCVLEIEDNFLLIRGASQHF